MIRRPGPVGALVLALALGACTTGADSPEGAPRTRTAAPTATAAGGGTFYAFLRQPASIDPAAAVEAEDLDVVDQVFDSLTATDERLRIVPAAATSWEANPAPTGGEGQPAEGPPPATVFTFELREDATFHDGQPVTAEAFKRAWQRILHRPGDTPSSAYYLLQPVVGFDDAVAGGPLSGVTAVDEHTLRVELAAPLADLPAVVSHPGLAPVPQDAIDDPARFERSPVGNGPFQMAEPWQPGRFIRLDAFDGHPAPPGLDQIVYRIYEGDDAVDDGYEDFRSGNLDVSPVPDRLRAAAIGAYGRGGDGAAGPGVLDGVKLITAFYGFNTQVPPYDDPAVRQALSHLIDRQALVEDVVRDARAPATSVVPAGIGGYVPPECAVCEFDPERARELLGERRFGPGAPDGQLELTIYRGADHGAVAQRIERDVNEVLGPGAITVTELSQADWLEAIRTGEAGLFLSGWLAEYPAADTFLYPLFHRGHIGSDNLTRYDSAEVSDLLDRARRELDEQARAELYHQAEATVLRDAPVLPLFHYRHARVVAERVRGYTLTPMGTVDMTEVTLERTE